MTSGRVGREPLRSSVPILLGAASGAVIVGLRIWDPPGWSGLAVLGACLVVIVGWVVAVGRHLVRAVTSRGSDPAVALIITPRGFAIRPTIAPGFLAGMNLCLLGMLVGPVVDDWHSGAASADLVDTAFTVVLRVMVAVMAVLTAFLVWYGWRAFGVELTPAGIVSRAPLHRRLIPWSALAPDAPSPWVRPDAGSVHLVVHRPDLVVQRGRYAMGGARQPVLPADRHGRLLAASIHRYVENPTDRAAIGTPAELDRLVAHLSRSAVP